MLICFHGLLDGCVKDRVGNSHSLPFLQLQDYNLLLSAHSSDASVHCETWKKIRDEVQLFVANLHGRAA